MGLFRRFLADEGGGPAIEFALVAMFVAFSFPAIMDITTMIDNHLKLSSGMRAGQQFALKHAENVEGIETAIENASNLPADSVEVTTEEFCECNGLSNSCESNCIGGFALARYVTITASYDISGEYNYVNTLYPSTLTTDITVRIE